MNVLHATRQAWPSIRQCSSRLNKNKTTPVPDDYHITRITGRETVPYNEFIDTGYDDLKCVLNIAEVYGYTQGRIMEWGVGCGRMFRHLPDDVKLGAIGTDVDTVNIDWCTRNFKFGKFEVLQPFGKFKSLDNSIGLLYSFSVMTHLCEVAQLHWLSEINRILSGVAVISVHGLYSAATTASWAKVPRDVNRWLEEGFKDSKLNNPDIITEVPDLYYKDIAHTPKYIKDVWSRHINVVDVVPGGFGTLHDAVVCTKKKD